MSGPELGRFKNFTVFSDISYGSIRSQPLPLDIIIPKNIESFSGPRPVIANIHGGALLAGARDFQPFWAISILQWAERKGAVIVAPDYPLAPESKTPEIVSALKTFMQWLQTDLQSTLDEKTGGKVQADLSRLAIQGESAGGWAALQVGLMYPDLVKALIMRFPMVDLDDREFFEQPLKSGQMVGYPVQPISVYEEHLAAMESGKIVTAGPFSTRLGMVTSAYGNGKLLDALSYSEETFPLRRLEAGGARLPKRIWIFHGTQDGTVPVSGSVKTAALIKEKVQGSEVRFDQRDGDHGFDTEWSIDDADPVLGERLDWLAEEWLR